MLKVYELNKSAKCVSVDPFDLDRMSNKDSTRILYRDVMEHGSPTTYTEIVEGGKNDLRKAVR